MAYRVTEPKNSCWVRYNQRKNVYSGGDIPRTASPALCVYSGQISIYDQFGKEKGPVKLFEFHVIAMALALYWFAISFRSFSSSSLLRRVISKEGKKTILYSIQLPIFFFFSSGSIARIVHRRVGKLGQVSMADDGLLLIPFQSRWRRANKTPSRASLNWRAHASSSISLTSLTQFSRPPARAAALAPFGNFGKSAGNIWIISHPKNRNVIPLYPEDIY